MHRFSIVVHWKGLLFHKKHVTLTKQEIRGDLMKEKIYTIPVNEAFETHDECPFCHLERDTEQRAIKYVLGPGASYMEPEVRLATDKAGFCREHYKKMFDFGNHLGSALIMQTYFVSMFEEMVHLIREDTVRRLCQAKIERTAPERKAVAHVTVTKGADNSAPDAPRNPVKAAKKIGRNDPCPCGSGKKYKNCCGKNV